MAGSGEPLASLAFDLVAQIGVSERFTALAALWVLEGLQTLNRELLEQEAQQGLGEALAIAHYKALVLLPARPALQQPVTELLLRYRLLCALEGVDDRRSQAFWLRHGLDRELLESQALHTSADLAASRRLEQFCFGRHLAAYFGIEPEFPPLESSLTPLQFTGLEPVLGHLWRFRPDPAVPSPPRHAYLLAPQPQIGIAASDRLCDLVARALPLLLAEEPDPAAVLCVPLGTRKLSLSKQGWHSCSTYFDGGKPLPFSLNRSLEPYLLLSPVLLEQAAPLRSLPLRFAPLLDSLSCLVFREPADYRLGDGAFLHQPFSLPRSALTDTPLPLAPDRCLLEGLLLQARSVSCALTPCHQFADRYARARGLSGHGPSGVMNQSMLALPEGLLFTWRYERNFDSWSGRSADVARHPSLNFLAWQAAADAAVQIAPLTYSGYPSECKIEDLRLFAVDQRLYASSALILSRSRYQAWLPELDAEAAAHNTIDDMLVVQALGRLHPGRAELEFLCLPVLQQPADPERPGPPLPRGFEKNWLICPWQQRWALLYAVQPWQVFANDGDLCHWQRLQHRQLALPPSLQEGLRNSAHPFPLPARDGAARLGLVVHRRRPHTYIYDQYLMVLDGDRLEPLCISCEPILSIHAAALESDPGFRKNAGVCYVSAVSVQAGRVQIYVNLFDCRTCVVTLAVEDLLALVDDESCFVALWA